MSQYEEIKVYLEKTDKEEIKEFFKAYTKEEHKTVELFKVITDVDREVHQADWVFRYFYYRDLIIENKSDDDVVGFLKEIIAQNQKVWDDYVGGKDGASGRFIGGLVGKYKVPAEKAKEVVEKMRISKD